MRVALVLVVFAALFALALGFASQNLERLRTPRATVVAVRAAKKNTLSLLPQALWKGNSEKKGQTINWAPNKALRSLGTRIRNVADAVKRSAWKLLQKPAGFTSNTLVMHTNSSSLAAFGKPEQSRALTNIALCVLIAQMVTVLGFPMLQQHFHRLEPLWQQVQQLGGAPAVVATVAVRDIATNLAGGAMVQIMNPFRVGDHVSFRHAGQLIEGTIIRRGFYYTTVQSRDTTPHFVPNSAFLSASVTNLSRVPYQFCEIQLALPAGLADKVPSIASAIKERLLTHPSIALDKPVSASLTGVGPSSLTLHASCFFRKDGQHNARELQQSFLLEVLGTAQAQGAALAAPPTP